MDLRTVVSRVGSTVVLSLDGVADLATAPTLHRELARLAPGPGESRVAVDIDGLTVLDDVAVGLIIGAAARLRDQAAELVIVCTSPHLVRLLARLRVDRIVAVDASIVPSITPVAASGDS
jgi:anti-anti-sigma factor